MTLSKDELYEKFNLLPEDIKEAFYSLDTYDVLEKLVEHYRLHIDQMGQLSEQIGFVMLGVTKPDDFLSNVQQKLNIPLNIAGEIVKEINSKIFFPIRTSLEKLNNGGVATYRPEQATKVENFSPAGNVSRDNIQKPQQPLPTPNNNAIIVGNTAPLGDQSGDKKLFDEKMGKLFRLPKEEVELGSTGSGPSDSVAKERTVDPYRELTQ